LTLPTQESVTVSTQADLSKTNLRQAFGQFATGVTVISCEYQGKKIGMTANSFNTVSLNPPLILWSVQKSSSRHEAMSCSEQFTVNVLNTEQENLSSLFAGRESWLEADWASLVDHKHLPYLAIKNCLVNLLCERKNIIDAGDHHIVLGEVKDIVYSSSNSTAQPLLYFGSQYRQLST
jgi:flavin reductase (DIM6/NTAB) family NADH-FMN oxidoreductase RutF